MSTRIWQGGAQVVRQLNTITPTAANSQTYTITINGKTVNYLSDASATVPEITAGLVAAAQASPEPEFQEILWQDSGPGTAVTATGPDTGAPFTQTSSSTGGTLVTVVTTAASGPNRFGVAANWSGGAVPVSGDDLIFDATSSVDLLYDISQAAVVPTSTTIYAGYAGKIGLPERNERGYDEYRPTYFAIGGPVTIGLGDGSGSGRLKIDNGASATTFTVYSTGSPIDSGVESVLWKGTHAANAVHIMAGSVGLAVLAGEVATIINLRVGGDNPRVRGGVGLTLAALSETDGEVVLNNTFTNLTKTGGTLTVFGACNITTCNNDGGPLFWKATGTITTYNGSAGARFQKGDPRPSTITSTILNAGTEFVDPFRSITYTNPILLNRCSIADLKEFDIGTHITLAVAAGP